MPAAHKTTNIMTSNNRRKFLKATTGIALSSVVSAYSGRVLAVQNSNDQLRAQITGRSSKIAGISLRHKDKLQKIYAARNHVPLWSKDGNLTRIAQAVIEKLSSSALLGLHSSNYYPKVLQSWIYDSTAATNLEILLTDSLHEYFDNVANGQTGEKPGDPGTWHQKQSHTNVEYTISRFFSGDATFRETIDLLQPASQHYTNLLTALREHYAILQQGGYTAVPDGNTIAPGDANPRITKLRARLLQSGDLQGSFAAQNDVYNHDLIEAVKNFQQRHGLEADGVVGSKTLTELNVPVEHRITQIEINLDRWRWLPQDLGADHIVVNTAGYEMDVTLQYNRVVKMGVVVGKPKHRTPIFSDEMEHLVFKPSWNVPKSISANELLPKEHANPGYLDSSNFEVVSRSDKSARPVSTFASYELEPSYFNARYRLRQKPGKSNALGDLKFMFPNRHSIYLHDTNAKHLFGKIKRAFSHGCIRVEDPELLAQVILQNDGRDSYQVDEFLASRHSKTVNLKQHLPVHLTYQTSWVDDSGKVQFRSDMYGHDDHAIDNYRKSRPQQIANETYALSNLGITTASTDL